ncbi:MAG: TatD family hydrolase [Phycisphaerae bacterium]|nr:TatD family hydrolase [Phycisphaerae bacterium]
MSDPHIESMIDLIDSHCHLTLQPLSRRVEDVLEEASAVGVRRCVTIGIDVADSRAATSLAARFENVWATAGVHPHEAGKADEGTWAELAEVLEAGGVVAVGETGLDYHYDFSHPERQREAFIRQIGLAERYDLPLVIHCREAVADALAILSEHGTREARGVFHCFTGTRDEAVGILEAGWHISLSGIVTFKNARDVREAAKIIPPDRLLLETDAPYCSPEPVRNVHPNTPGHVVHTCRFLAELYGESAAALAARCNAAAEGLFGLGG